MAVSVRRRDNEANCKNSNAGVGSNKRQEQEGFSILISMQRLSQCRYSLEDILARTRPLADLNVEMTLVFGQ